MPEPPSYAPPGTNGSRRRHGRIPVRESPGDAAVRHRMVRLAVLPAGLIAVAGAAVVAYVLRAGGGLDTTGAPAPGPVGAPVWGVLAGSLLLVCAVIVTAAMLASSEARGTVERYTALRRSAVRGQAELRAMLRGLERGERPKARPRAPEAEPEPAGDALDLLSYELGLAQRNAEAAVAEAAAVVRSTYSGSEEKVEVFVNLARRLQSLVHREIELLDELENEVEDPDLLKGLFHVDHLATRIRRHAENLAVLGGAVSRRQWTRPVSMTEVLRSAIAEVEQYPRVKLVPPIEGTLRGHAVADVIHLLAELIENATVFSAPQTQVLLRAQYVTAGLAIEVEDRGLGMTAAEQNHMNAVLSEPDRIDVPELLRDGRIGLFVVSALARRHGVVVQLQSNIYGGIQAVLVVPRGLLGEEAAEDAAAGPGAASAVPPQAAAATPVPLPAERPEPEHGTAQPHPSEAWQAGESAPEEQGADAVSPHPVRPRLPKRRRQEHLVPELRDPPGLSGRGSRAEAVAEEGHDPGLMAAFRRGTSLADETDLDGEPYRPPAGENPSDPSPAPGGDASRTAR
ncbi:sensor histidine kinase [Streptomyces boncukensis]|uniref:sensor histidine kinase n=1 Tax=Streptomyces boncukensis TaxID=2711219 RepID=UPI0019CFD537|nr:ATP-binding protein [Streptomyces boncukensis]